MYARTRFNDKTWAGIDWPALGDAYRPFFTPNGRTHESIFVIYDDLENMAAERPPEKPKADWEASALDRLKQAKKAVSTSSLLDSLMQRLDA
jgi:hypothetical protein